MTLYTYFDSKDDLLNAMVGAHPRRARLRMPTAGRRGTPSSSK